MQAKQLFPFQAAPCDALAQGACLQHLHARIKRWGPSLTFSVSMAGGADAAAEEPAAKGDPTAGNVATSLALASLVRCCVSST
jgi:hypothetical protein